MPGNRPKLLHLAMALCAGLIANGTSESQQYAMGQQLKYQLANAHKNIRSGKPTRAAHYKRLAKKRRIQRARSAKK